MRVILQILFILISNSLFANLPDSILVNDSASSFFPYPLVKHTQYSIVKKTDAYVVYQTYRFQRNKHNPKAKKNYIRTEINKVPFKTIEHFLHILEDNNYTEPKLIHFGISKEVLENNTHNQFEFIKSNYYYWKDFQVDYVKKELSTYANILDAFDSLYPKGNIPEPSQKFIISIYTSGKVEKEIAPSVASFGLPWLIDTRKSYNPEIGIAISRLFPEEQQPKSVNLEGTTENLLHILTSRIYNKKCEEMIGKLAVKEFEEEFSEIEEEFEIIERKEYYFHGRYLSMENKKEPYFKVILKNEKMVENMEFVYFISKQENSLYPKDSLLSDYVQMLDKVKEITFLMEYLNEDTTSKLTLFYFDNNGMNDYLKNSFNGNKEQWELFDKGDKEAQYEHLYCGCNFRYADEFLNDAIMFELTCKSGSSIWYLLPDGTPILHHFSGSKVYKYTSMDMGTKTGSVQYACKKFDKNGNIVIE